MPHKTLLGLFWKTNQWRTNKIIRALWFLPTLHLPGGPWRYSPNYWWMCPTGELNQKSNQDGYKNNIWTSVCSVQYPDVCQNMQHSKSYFDKEKYVFLLIIDKLRHTSSLCVTLVWMIVPTGLERNKIDKVKLGKREVRGVRWSWGSTVGISNNNSFLRFDCLLHSIIITSWNGGEQDLCVPSLFCFWFKGKRELVLGEK